MKLDFDTLDVFTDRRFGGNPLAVVHGADQLDTETMQTIAREFALSETVFILKPENSAHSARMRIFTPQRELAFAGHPTVGTAALLAEERLGTGTHNGEALIVLEQEAGIVRVGVRLRAGKPTFAEFDAPRLPAAAGSLAPRDVLAAGLGLIPSEIGFENHKPVCFAAGHAFAFVPVSSREVLSRARVVAGHWDAAFEEQGVLGAYLYTRQCEHTGSAFQARMFAPRAGIPEDPATGSAAVCLAGVIWHFDELPDGVHRRTIEQGFQMGRPSFIALVLNVDGDELVSVRIGGHCVRVTNGTITV